MLINFVILSEAKNPAHPHEILRFAQNDSYFSNTLQTFSEISGRTARRDAETGSPREIESRPVFLSFLLCALCVLCENLFLFPKMSDNLTASDLILLCPGFGLT